MRVLPLVVGLVCLAVPVEVMGKPKPKIAVAPLANDPGGTVAEAVVESLAGQDFAIIGPRDTGREMTKLGIDELDAKATRKLTDELDVAAVIDGKVGKPGRKRTVRLTLHRPGKPAAAFTVEFTSLASPALRRGVHLQVTRRMSDGSEAAEEEEEKPVARRDDERKRSEDAEERPRKRSDDDDEDARARKRIADDEPRPRKRSDDDEERSRKRVADDQPRVRKRSEDDEDEPRPRKGRKARDADAAHTFARVAAGVSIAQRELTYDVRSGFTQRPPRVLTTAGAGRVDAEVYPFGLRDPKSKLARLGLAAAYDKTVGLSIKVPNMAVSAPINQAHYAIGARYRFPIGEASTVAVGLDYMRRHYIADRAPLMAAVLDCPDVDYAAVAPSATAHIPVTPTITVLAALNGMLMLEAGPIQETTSYGPATVYGLEVTGGVDIAIRKQIGLRIALEYSRISLSFSNKGTMTTSRDGDAATQDINGATDRWIGIAATLGLVY